MNKIGYSGYRFPPEIIQQAIGVKIDIDGDIDLRGFFGLDDRVRAGFNAVRIRVTLAGPESEARYDELAQTVDAHCRVLDLFRNPVPVERAVTVAA
ncbi:MAG: OsmC family protein [Hyphomicrobiales bacterium]|nr:OsmC family protein [Hyphomicrobiales bacterium]